jgi:hypothetical protein
MKYSSKAARIVGPYVGSLKLFWKKNSDKMTMVCKLLPSLTEAQGVGEAMGIKDFCSQFI